MKYKIKLWILLSLLLLNISCIKEVLDQDVITQAEVIIAPAYTTCQPSMDVIVSDCLIVTDISKNTSYAVSKNAIVGFNYELGYRYRILVKVTKLSNPPMDSGDTEYELIKIISKVKE